MTPKYSLKKSTTVLIIVPLAKAMTNWVPEYRGAIEVHQPSFGLIARPTMMPVRERRAVR
jgi:hypothetical protein